MRRLQKALSALIVVGALGGCYGASEAYVVDATPPPTRDEVVVYRPGFFWVHGHWFRDGGRWAWRSGYYEPARPDQIYVEGRWERRGRGHVWVDGGWHRRGRVVVRDHR